MTKEWYCKMITHCETISTQLGRL